MITERAIQIVTREFGTDNKTPHVEVFVRVGEHLEPTGIKAPTPEAAAAMVAAKLAGTV